MQLERAVLSIPTMRRLYVKMSHRADIQDEIWEATFPQLKGRGMLMLSYACETIEDINFVRVTVF